MTNIGIVRRIDEVGRVVLPIEIRNSLEIAEKDPIEIWLDGKNIVLRKYENNCSFCASEKNLEEIMGKLMCRACQRKLKNKLEK